MNAHEQRVRALLLAKSRKPWSCAEARASLCETPIYPFRKMTFAVVLASRTAIWACADRRLTPVKNAALPANSGVKVACVETRDGVALLTYAGIGSVRATQISQWVCSTLRGIRDLPLEHSLLRVSNAGQRRLMSHAYTARCRHFFIAAAIRERRHYIYHTELRKGPPQWVRQEPKTRDHVKIGVAGSGEPYALRYERARMTNIARLIKRYERNQISAEFVAAQLASLNAVVSSHAQKAKDLSVSPACVVVYRHPGNKKGLGGGQWYFDDVGRPTNSDVDLPIVANGIPVSEICGALMSYVRKQMDATPSDASPEERCQSLFPDAATSQALVGQISDKPDEEFH